MDTNTQVSGSIVVGIDGSPYADQALEWAVDQAVAERRPLTIVHANLLDATWWMDQAGIDHRRVIEAIKENAADILAAAATRARELGPDLEIHEELRLQDPREALLAASEHAAMIVIGSRGRGPVRSLVLGSVSAAVAKHAHCPVVVLRPRDTEIEREGVLVGVDGTEHSRNLLEFAYRQASVRRMQLTVMYCFWDARGALEGPTLVAEDDQEHDDIRLLLSECISGMAEKFPDVVVRPQLARGLVDECLVAAAGRVDLLVVGSKPRNRIVGLLRGSTATSVLEHAQGVIAVVPETTEDH
ncbi:universal stress protein [Nocardioides sp.]|uniref:universal stress protein n=1 Tax=Nocardioides sp. TaxID=35761 RepID=UPI003568FA19